MTSSCKRPTIHVSAVLSLQGKVYFYGVKVVKIYVREITATYGSQAYFYAPNWKQEYSRRVITGKDGEDGKKGIDGAKGRLKYICLCSEK